MTGNKWFSARTIVEEDVVSATIDEETSKYRRLNEIFEGLKWRLARKPEDGYPISEDKMMIKTYSWSIDGAAAITAIYSYDDESVVVEAVRVSSSDEE